MGGVVTDIYQSTDCSGSADIVSDFCANQAVIKTEVNTDQSGVVKVGYGIQDVDQTIYDCSTADCANQGALFTQIGSTTAPVTGTVNTDYSQYLNQNLECDKVCSNQATIDYFAKAIDNPSTVGTPTLNSKSTQGVDQNSECNSSQTCTNQASMTNDVSVGSTTSVGNAILNADTNQYINQDCSGFSGTSCFNQATMKNVVSATGSSRLNAYTDQTIYQDCTGYAGSTCSNMDMVTSTGNTLSTAQLTYFADQTVYNDAATTGNTNPPGYSITISKNGAGTVSATETPPAPLPGQNPNNVNNVAYTSP
jgi:hypothetical protein